MALIASQQFNDIIAYQLYQGYGFQNNGFSTFLVYGGTVPPLGVMVSTQWITYKATRAGDLLSTVTGTGFENGDQNPGALYFGAGNPTPTNADANGTATWIALQSNTESQIALIGDCTEAGGGGLFILDSVTVTTSTPITVIGFRMKW